MANPMNHEEGPVQTQPIEAKPKTLSRRDFLKGAIAGAAGLGLAACTPEPVKTLIAKTQEATVVPPTEVPKNEQPTATKEPPSPTPTTEPTKKVEPTATPVPEQQVLVTDAKGEFVKYLQKEGILTGEEKDFEKQLQAINFQTMSLDNPSSERTDGFNDARQINVATYRLAEAELDKEKDIDKDGKPNKFGALYFNSKGEIIKTRGIKTVLGSEDVKDASEKPTLAISFKVGVDGQGKDIYREAFVLNFADPLLTGEQIGKIITDNYLNQDATINTEKLTGLINQLKSIFVTVQDRKPEDPLTDPDIYAPASKVTADRTLDIAIDVQKIRAAAASADPNSASKILRDLESTVLDALGLGRVEAEALLKYEKRADGKYYFQARDYGKEIEKEVPAIPGAYMEIYKEEDKETGKAREYLVYRAEEGNEYKIKEGKVIGVFNPDCLTLTYKDQTERKDEGVKDGKDVRVEQLTKQTGTVHLSAEYIKAAVASGKPIFDNNFKGNELNRLFFPADTTEGGGMLIMQETRTAPLEGIEDWYDLMVNLPPGSDIIYPFVKTPSERLLGANIGLQRWGGDTVMVGKGNMTRDGLEYSFDLFTSETRPSQSLKGKEILGNPLIENTVVNVFPSGSLNIYIKYRDPRPISYPYEPNICMTTVLDADHPSISITLDNFFQINGVVVSVLSNNNSLLQK